ncbi:MAG: PaaI family thioesterase [Candidatus Hermodarchaeota archaeon]
MSTNYKQFFSNLFNEKARIAQNFGMKLTYNEENQAIITLPYNPLLDHAGDGIHGGVIATVLDNAGWFTIALARNGFVVTSEMSFHLLRPAANTEIWARGKIIRMGKRQAVAEMQCWDDNENLIAHSIGTYLYFENKLTQKLQINLNK